MLEWTGEVESLLGKGGSPDVGVAETAVASIQRGNLPSWIPSRLAKIGLRH